MSFLVRVQAPDLHFNAAGRGLQVDDQLVEMVEPDGVISANVSLDGAEVTNVLVGRGHGVGVAALAALAGCTNVIGNKVAHKLGLDVSNFNVSIVADFNRRGVTLSEEIDVPFEAIKLRVELSTTATQGEIDQLAVEVAKYCPLAKLFRQAGTKLEEEWVIRAA